MKIYDEIKKVELRFSFTLKHSKPGRESDAGNLRPTTIPFASASATAADCSLGGLFASNWLNGLFRHFQKYLSHHQWPTICAHAATRLVRRVIALNNTSCDFALPEPATFDIIKLKINIFKFLLMDDRAPYVMRALKSHQHIIFFVFVWFVEVYIFRVYRWFSWGVLASVLVGCVWIINKFWTFVRRCKDECSLASK